MPKRAVLILVLAALAGGCGGDSGLEVPLEEPDAFFKRLLGYELSGQFGKSWDMLHPAHQELVSRAKYASCSRDDFGSTRLAGVETVEMYEQPIDIEAVPEKTSKAVTLKITLETNGREGSSTHTFHAVRLPARWAWYFGNAHVAAYRDGVCP